MKKQELYYRPEWTCGRYDRENKATIMYNLIEGMSFYYEDITAEVIGCILSVERNLKSQPASAIIVFPLNKLNFFIQ